MFEHLAMAYKDSDYAVIFVMYIFSNLMVQIKHLYVAWFSR